MSDVLSQSEIDALLAAFASGDVTPQDVGSTSANEEDIPCTVLHTSLKFTDKDIQILEHIHTEYTEILCSKMFRNLEVKISLQSIQELRYEEFMQSISYPTVTAVFKLHPLEDCLLLETSPSLVLQIADLLSGGDGSEHLNSTPFSEKDKAISMQIATTFIGYLKEAWKKVLKVTSEIKYLEIDPAQIKPITNNESIALISFSMSIGNTNAYFNICIPYSSIKKYLGTLEIKNIPNSSADFIVSDNFGAASLTIKVLLDTIELSLGELMNLEKGTVLNTHKKYTNKVKLFVQEKHCFNGEVGLLHNRKAVKILDCLEKDV